MVFIDFTGNHWKTNGFHWVLPETIEKQLVFITFHRKQLNPKVFITNQWKQWKNKWFSLNSTRNNWKTNCFHFIPFEITGTMRAPIWCLCFENTRTHAHTHTRTHTQPHTQPHIHTHTKHTHTHIHTHTKTRTLTKKWKYTENQNLSEVPAFLTSTKSEFVRGSCIALHRPTNFTHKSIPFI